MSTFLQQLVNGLTVGGVYALIALGYTMVYGIIQLINFAHGEIYMIGAYLGIIILGVIAGLNINSTILVVFLLFLTAIVFCGAYGFTIEKLAYKPLRTSHRLSPLISALGMSIFLQNYVMLTQGKRDKVYPYVIAGKEMEFYGVVITNIQIFIILTSIVLMIFLHLFIKNTKIGIAMRATSIDRTMASLLGINVDKIISITFIIGSALAAVAGVMIGVYYGKINFFIGYLAGLKAFTAAVLGGIGNVPGAMIGGFVLGMLESLGAGYISPVYKDAFAFAVLIIVLIFKPTGLFGERVPEKY